MGRQQLPQRSISYVPNRLKLSALEIRGRVLYILLSSYLPLVSSSTLSNLSFLPFPCFPHCSPLLFHRSSYLKKKNSAIWLPRCFVHGPLVRAPRHDSTILGISPGARRSNPVRIHAVAHVAFLFYPHTRLDSALPLSPLSQPSSCSALPFFRFFAFRFFYIPQ